MNCFVKVRCVFVLFFVSTTLCNQLDVQSFQAEAHESAIGNSYPAHQVKLADVLCPGGHYRCGYDQTCCPFQSMYTCCPKSHAACCGLTCCRNGYRCSSRRICVPVIGSLLSDRERSVAKPVIEKTVKTVKAQSDVTPVMCADHVHTCPNGQTCCKYGFTYSCCPAIRGSCCSDGLHCCRNGYKCNDQNKCDPAIENLFRKA